MENKFYIYAYLDPTKPGIFNYENFTFDYKPFYIGKGCDKKNYKRCLVHIKKVKNNTKFSNLHLFNTINKILSENLEPIIIKIKENLESEESYLLEYNLIEEIGLENLTNLVPGGKGGIGLKTFLGKTHTKESKKKMSESHKGSKNPMFGNKWFRSEEGKKSYKEKFSGKNHFQFNKKRDDLTKQKISEKLKGFKYSEESAVKKSEGMKLVWEERRKNKIFTKNTKRYLFTIDDKTYFVYGNLKKFKKEFKYKRINKQLIDENFELTKNIIIYK